jgi:hypothetical protein
MQLKIIRSASIVAFVASLAAMTAGSVQAAVAASPVTATTASASGVAATTATLNGTLGTGKGTAIWEFEYGPNVPNTTFTTGVAFTASTTADPVFAEVNELIPSTKYIFRLIALNNVSGMTSDPFVPEDGAFLSFKTSGAGSASLVSRKLKVKHGRVALRLSCASTLTCAGQVSITAKSASGAKLACGTASFTIAAGEKESVTTSKVSGNCATLLSSASNKTISAKLEAKFSTYQPALSKNITLTS